MKCCQRCRRKLKAHEMLNKSTRYRGALCDGCKRAPQNEHADMRVMTQLDKILRKRWV